jgi:hypothetical protein
MHIPVTDEQYYEALPPNGLQLAEQNLNQDYQLLLENDLPIKDTVTGLFMVHQLQAESQEESEA